MKERPTSSRSRRLLTESFATIWLTVKCLPTSRRNSVNVTVVSQVALLSNNAWDAPAPGEKSRKRLSCSRMPSMLASS